MKDTDDDQPGGREKQARPDKKQPTVTEQQVKTIVKSQMEVVQRQLNDTFAKSFKGVQDELKQVFSLLEGAKLDKLPGLIPALAAKFETAVAVAVDAGAEKISVAGAARDERFLSAIKDVDVSATVKGIADDLSTLNVAVTGNHDTVVQRFNDLDLEVSETRKGVQQANERLVGMSQHLDSINTQLTELSRETRKLKRHSGELKNLIGVDGATTRSLIVAESESIRETTGTAIDLVADYIVDETGALVKAESSSLNQSIGELLAAVMDVPNLLGKDMMERVAKLINLATEISATGQTFADNIKLMSDSSYAAFTNNKNLINSLDVQFKAQLSSVGSTLDARATEVFDGITNRLNTTLDNFDAKADFEAMKESVEWVRDAYKEANGLVQDFRNWSENIDESNTNLRHTIDAQTEKLIDNVGDKIVKTEKYLKTVFEGMAQGSDLATSIVNRIQDMSLEAYKREIERIEKGNADREELRKQAFVDFVDAKLNEKFGEHLASLVSHLIATGAESLEDEPDSTPSKQ